MWKDRIVGVDCCCCGSAPLVAVLVGPVIGTRAPIDVAPALSVPCIVSLIEALVIIVGVIMALTLAALVVSLIVAHRLI